MFQVGFATALGLVLEVPILIRSLADSFAEVDIRHFPLGFHPSLLAALDDGVAMEGPTRLVESYAYNWWKQKKEPVGTVHGFGLETVHECLNHHRQYIAAPTEAAWASEAATATAPGHPKSSRTPAPALTSEAATATATARPPPHNPSDADCGSCIKLLGVVHDLLDHARSTQGMIDGFQSSDDAAMNANVRRAAGFQRVHELALLKEPQAERAASNDSGRVEGPKKTAIKKRSELVAARAQAELERLRSLPPSSHKWTWGVDITEKDVLGTGKGKGKAHSGYVVSLEDGPMGGKEWSSTPSSVLTRSVTYSEAPPVTGIDAAMYYTGSSHSNDHSLPDAPKASDADADADTDADMMVGEPTAMEAAMTYNDQGSSGTGSSLHLPPTAFEAGRAWRDNESLDTSEAGTDAYADADGNVGQLTIFEAAMAWHEGDSSGTGSSSRSSANVVAAAFPTASDAADALDLSDDDTGSSSPSSANVVAPAFPTASDAADALDLSDDDDDDDDTDDDNVEPDSDDGDNDNNDNNDEDDEGSPPGSSQIHDLTPSAITLPIYGCEDFDYVDETWLMESERMMDMDTSTDSE